MLALLSLMVSYKFLCVCSRAVFISVMIVMLLVRAYLSKLLIKVCILVAQFCAGFDIKFTIVVEFVAIAQISSISIEFNEQ